MASLRCYDPGGSGGGMHRWYDDLTGDVQAAVDAALELFPVERDLERLPHFKPLRGACEGLDEVIVELGNRRHFRILEFRGPASGEFTLLFAFEKTRGSIDYGPSCWAAKQRNGGVIRDGRKAPPCQFP